MSLIIKRRVTLDLRRQGYQVTIPFVKADKGAHEVIFTIKDASEIVELPPGTVATIAVHNGVGGSGVLDSCIIDHNNNTVTYTPTPEALEVAGNVHCDLRLVDENGATVGSPYFIFQIADTGGDITEEELDTALKANDAWGVVVKTAMYAKAVRDEALMSEGYARGTQEGEAVVEDSPYFEQNAKYFCELACEMNEKTQERVGEITKDVESLKIDKQDKLAFNGTYNATSNKVATEFTVEQESKRAKAAEKANADNLAAEITRAKAAEKANAESLAEKVDTVSAGDKSIEIGGTSTEPTVKTKLSGDSDNIMRLTEDGLKVPSVEYSIVKSPSPGDYAAVYSLMRNGVQAGSSINIPRDMVVESGAVVERDGKSYIELKLQNVADVLYIDVSALIEYVTTGSAAGDMIVVSVSSDHKITAVITDGSITLAKLHSEIIAKLGSIPTKLSELTGDSAHRTVTDAEKAAWNAKSNFSGSYNDLTDKPTSGSGVELPESVLEILETNGSVGLTYDIYEEEGYAISAGNSGVEGNIEIGSKVKGYPVTAVGSAAFENNTSLVSVVIPDSVITVEEYAFMNATSLSSVTLGSSVEVIRGCAFQACSSLKRITLPASIAEIDSFAFDVCENLTDIYVPWSENDIEGAPWGATNATIHYESEV